jgi:hypothetical protein
MDKMNCSTQADRTDRYYLSHEGCIKTLPGNEMSGHDLLAGNRIISNERLPSDEISPCRTSENADNEILPRYTMLPGGMFLDNDSLPDEALHGNKTLPERSNALYGAPITAELLSPVLDAGVFALLRGSTEAASMLFYWAFTTQQSDTLVVTYTQIKNALGYSKPKISRTLNRIRESSLFSVRATPKGVFIDIKKLVSAVKNNFPLSNQVTGNETFPPVVVKDFTEFKNTTTTLSNETLQIFRSIKPLEFRVMADLLHWYKFTTKDISIKTIELIAECYAAKGLENIAYNLAYTSGKNASSRVGYLIKSLAEDYGGTCLPFMDMKKADILIETLRMIRDKKLDECTATNLREMLFILGNGVPEGTSRATCEDKLTGLMSKSDELYAKMSGIACPNKTTGYRRFVS